jgi:hypothetical protein
MPNKIIINIQTTCGVKTCDECKFHCTYKNDDMVSHVCTIYDVFLGYFPETKEWRRCEKCISEHRDNSFISELNNELKKTEEDIDKLVKDTKQRKNELISRNPIFGCRND